MKPPTKKTTRLQKMVTMATTYKPSPRYLCAGYEVLDTISRQEQLPQDDFNMARSETIAKFVLQAAYTILSEEELKLRQQEALQAVMQVLSISEGEAVRVLRHCKW